jgi:polyisoprenoid-binding protein YceI
MKKIHLITMSALAIFGLASCSSNAVEAGKEKDAANATEQSVTWTINSDQSELHWHGKKLAYGHSGLITIKSGELMMEGDKLTAGKFTIDMNTIRETGEGVDPESAAKLAGHLMNEDFFDAPKYPTSEFVITAAEKKGDMYDISGNLTIKDSTKNISFPAKIEKTETSLTATAEFTINRTDWGIHYSSGISGAVGDNVISDDIKFNVKLVAGK